MFWDIQVEIISKGEGDYREFVEEGLIKDIGAPFEDVKGQVVLGESSFVDWVYKNVMKKSEPDLKEQSRSKELIKESGLDQIIDTISKVFNVERNQLLKHRSGLKEARMVYIELSCRYRLFHKSLKEIGQESGGLTVGGMNQVRKRLKELLNRNKALKTRFDRCVTTLDKEQVIKK